MAIKRRITRGFGALTPNAWDSLIRTAEWAGRLRQPMAAMEASANAFASSGSREVYHFDARITTATQITGVGRWQYAFEEVRLAGSGGTEWAAVSGGITGDGATAYALNRLEAGNTATLAYGMTATSGVDLTAHSGFSLQRVPANTVVEMRAVRDADAAVRYEFSAMNPIDGSCP